MFNCELITAGLLSSIALVRLALKLAILWYSCTLKSDMAKSFTFDNLNACFVEASLEARELYLGNKISSCQNPPTPLEFYRNWVSKNVPCLFKNAISHWPALKKWNNTYLTEKLGSKNLTVAVTPNGFADAVTNEKFVLPEEKLMQMNEFLNVAQSNDQNNVYYIQKQNSNMLSEFQELLCDIELEIPWASAALNKSPDAINFWMGQGKAVTSLHKDPYENLYCVIKGQKHFILYPPCDRFFMPYKSFSVGKFCLRNNAWTIEDQKNNGDSTVVPWIAVDPLSPNYKKYPQFKNATAFECTVEAGDVFFLPSLWFHHVQQSDLTIAVNFWYDMDFDAKYVYYQTLDKLAKLMDQ